MEPILVSRNSCNKFLLIIIINDTNRMSSGKQNDWQAKARVNYFKVLDLGISCTEEWIRTIQITPLVKTDGNDSAQGGQREDKNPVLHSNLQIP